MNSRADMTNTDKPTPALIDLSRKITWEFKTGDGDSRRTRKSLLKMPTLGELLGSQFRDRKHLLFPWLREQENCMIYAGTGVGKSLFALSAALAVAGSGEFLGWPSERREKGEGWRVLYVDGEMHIADVQERAAMLLEASPKTDRELASSNLSILARQHQDPSASFPSITDPEGMKFFLGCIESTKLDLVIFDNFTTLGEVEDENSAASFNAIQEFLLKLKVQGVATILIHHAGKGGDFRGSSKLAATFETIIKLDRLSDSTAPGEARFRVCWDKVRAGGPKRVVKEVVASLTASAFGDRQEWTHETAALERLTEVRELLSEGAVINKKEIADYFGVSKTMAGRYVDRGTELGLWTTHQVNRWFGRGRPDA